MIFDDDENHLRGREFSGSVGSFVCSLDEQLEKMNGKIKARDFSDFYDVCRTEINVNFLMPETVPKTEPQKEIERADSLCLEGDKLQSREARDDSSELGSQGSFDLASSTSRYILHRRNAMCNLIKSRMKKEILSCASVEDQNEKTQANQIRFHEVKSKPKRVQSVVRLSEKHAASMQQVTDSIACLLCRKEFKPKEALAKVRACQHLFHLDCLESFLKTQAEADVFQCPLCDS